MFDLCGLGAGYAAPRRLLREMPETMYTFMASNFEGAFFYCWANVITLHGKLFRKHLDLSKYIALVFMRRNVNISICRLYTISSLNFYLFKLIFKSCMKFSGVIDPTELMLFFSQQKVDKLKFICLKYATATQWLIPAIFRQHDHFQQSGTTGKKSKGSYKERRGPRENPIQARQAAEDSNFKLTIGYLDISPDFP